MTRLRRFDWLWMGMAVTRPSTAEAFVVHVLSQYVEEGRGGVGLVIRIYTLKRTT